MESNRLERLSKMLRQVGATPDDLDAPISFGGVTGASGEATPDVDLLESIPGGVEIATESLDFALQGRTEDIDPERQAMLEAIVMPFYRPVVDISEGRLVTAQLGRKWQHLGDAEPRGVIESILTSIGRIEIPHNPSLPYAGTGFVVGKRPDGRGILMTNRHVAEIFASGIGISDLQFRLGQTVAIDFLREYGHEDKTDTLTVEKVLMIHPYWDMALLQVVGLSEDRIPLKLSAADPARLQDREVVTIGYPGYDPNGDLTYQNTQNRIFRGVYYVKRLQPGLLKTREDVESYRQVVPAVTHDCSTLGGNSGSAVLMLPAAPGEPIEVIGLHFAGAYLRANYAVPTYELAMDSQVVDTGIEFSGPLPPSNDRYGVYWTRLSSELPTEGSTPTPPPISAQAPSAPIGQTASTTGTTYTWKIPLEISITLGTPELSTSVPSPVVTPVAPEEGLFGDKPQLSFADLIKKFSLPSFTADKFDWSTALSLAVASSVAYQDRSVVEGTAKNTWMFDDCKFIEADDTQCFIAASDDRVVVAFRGTKELRDWLANLNTFSTQKPYGAVHRGFYYAFAVVQAQLEQELDQRSPRSIFLTGHSLGGALATVAAAEWCDAYPITGVYTYGQPAVGKGLFSAFFGEHFTDTFFRFVNDDDIVPRVPPTYRHIGKLFHFDASDHLKPQTESLIGGADDSTPGVGKEMMTEAEFDAFRAQLLAQKAQEDATATTESLASPTLEGLFPSVSDHSLSEYIRKIDAQARSFLQ